MASRRETQTVIRALTAADAKTIASWRYPRAWSVYDIRDVSKLTPDRGYWAVIHEPGEYLVGFLCFGAEARVPGLDKEQGVLDVGVGFDPSLIGRGAGAVLVSPVLDWLSEHSTASTLRAVVQSWNRRSIRVCEHLGFVRVGDHTAHQGGRNVDYTVLRLVIPGPSDSAS
jgi:ribosomal-protein-alanine N-acetyltransferase